MGKNRNSNLTELAPCASCLTFNTAASPHSGLCARCCTQAGESGGLAEPQAFGKESASPLLAGGWKLGPLSQADKERCWACDKKSGPMAFDCRCGFAFCKRHRMPEQHACCFDFVADGKEQIARNNPSIKHSKIEKI